MRPLPLDYKLDALHVVRATVYGRPVIAPDAVVLEGGAGFGVVTDALARLAARVVACEPNAEAFRDLTERLRGHERRESVRAMPVALGPAGCGSTAYLNLGEEPWNSSVLDAPYARSLASLPVRQVDARALAEECGATCLVLDVEGAESFLVPALAALPALNTVVLEHHPAVLGKQGTAVVANTLWACGFAEVLTVPSWGHGAWFAAYRKES